MTYKWGTGQAKPTHWDMKDFKVHGKLQKCQHLIFICWELTCTAVWFLTPTWDQGVQIKLFCCGVMGPVKSGRCRMVLLVYFHFVDDYQGFESNAGSFRNVICHSAWDGKWASDLNMTNMLHTSSLPQLSVWPFWMPETALLRWHNISSYLTSGYG